MISLLQCLLNTKKENDEVFMFYQSIVVIFFMIFNETCRSNLHENLCNSVIINEVGCSRSRQNDIQHSTHKNYVQIE